MARLEIFKFCWAVTKIIVDLPISPTMTQVTEAQSSTVGIGGQVACT